MINEQNEDLTLGHRIFKIRSHKFRELLNAIELNLSQDSITLFTIIEKLPKEVGAIFIEKSALETAYEEFMKKAEDSE